MSPVLKRRMVTDAIVVLLACTGGAALQATTGFGFSLLAAPALVRTLGATEAIGLLGVLSVLVNTLTLTGGPPGRARRGPTILTLELLRLAVPATAGLVAGAVLLGLVPDAVLQGALAVAVLAALLVRHDPEAAPPEARAWRVVAGFTAGLMTTTIGVNGPPLVLWLRARHATPEQQRATLAVAFLAAGGATVAVLGLMGDLQFGTGTALLGAAGVTCGHAVGRRRAAGMAVHRHERLVTGALALSAVAAAASAVAG